MIDQQKVLAIVPARSGSMEVPHKNIRDLAGKPLIAWSIEAATKSQYVDTVILSTDSEEYAEIGRKWGAEVPSLRPAELSTSESGLIDSLCYTVKALARLGKGYDILICLQPTSPLRNYQHIDDALLLFNELDSPRKKVVSVVELNKKYAWVMKKTNRGVISFLDTELHNNSAFSRHSSSSVCLPNGAIFISHCNDLDSFYTSDTYPFFMESSYSVDIDTEEDFNRCEELIKGMEER